VVQGLAIQGVEARLVISLHHTTPSEGTHCEKEKKKGECEERRDGEGGGGGREVAGRAGTCIQQRVTLQACRPNYSMASGPRRRAAPPNPTRPPHPQPIAHHPPEVQRLLLGCLQNRQSPQ
jgi:hypothetical protein